MAEQEKQGFIIDGVFYPWPEGFRLGDPVLIREVTGLSWAEFSDLMDESNGEVNDPAVMNGMIAAAIWQANPRWTREKARRYVEQIQFEEIEVQGGDDEDDAVPPPPAEPPFDDSPDPLSPEPSLGVSEITPPSSGVSA